MSYLTLTREPHELPPIDSIRLQCEVDPSTEDLRVRPNGAGQLSIHATNDRTNSRVTVIVSHENALGLADAIRAMVQEQNA